MQKPPFFFKFLVVALTIIFVGLNLYFFVYREDVPCGCELMDRPTIGNPQAEVHVTLYEDLLCPECIRFSNAIFPMIEAQFIEKGRIQFTIVPVAITGDSGEMTRRMNCLHHRDPNGFWNMLKVAMHDLEFEGGFDLSRLPPCDHPDHHAEIAKNTAHINHLLGHNTVSPAFFVNGKYIGYYTYTNLVGAIEEALSP